MAKAQGIVNIEGTVENYTFYKKNGQNFVRRKGGVSKERISSDPNYVRTRENNSEFAHSGNSGKLLRDSIGSMVFKAKDGRLSNRLLQTMSRIKNLDSTSTRGSRKVALGIATVEGKLHLKGFNFNINAPLQSVLFVPYTLDIVTGTFEIKNLIPAQDMAFPEGATNVSFQTAALGVDFDTTESELVFSNGTVNLAITMAPQDVMLELSSIPVTDGVVCFLLLITFYQEVNGIQYSLKNEIYNSLSILDVV